MKPRQDNRKYYYCYSPNLKLYIEKNGISPIVYGISDTTRKHFWVFERSEQLHEILEEYSYRKKLFLEKNK